MSAENEMHSESGTRFAVDLRHQFEGLAEGASRSPGPLGAGAAASATRYRWLAIVGVITAVVAAGVALTLLVARSGTGPNRQLAVASPTAVQSSPGAKQQPGSHRMAPPTEPDVTMIWEVTIDGAGRPWLTGSRAHDQPLLAYLDGGQWVQLPGPKGATTLGPIAVLSADDLWAPVAHGFVHWDGTAWQKKSAPLLDGDIAGIESMAALSTSDIWAVGHQKGGLYTENGAGGEHTVGYRPLTMHWDGAEWSDVKVPASQGRTSTLQAAATSGGETWAVGYFERKTGEQAQASGPPLDITSYGTIALRWDGARWIDMATPIAGARGTALGDVLVLARDDVWVLGRTYHGDESRYRDETISTYLVHWDGLAWQQIQTPQGKESGDFWSLAGTSDGDIWLSGNGRDGIPHGETAHWDGANWAVFTPTTLDENGGGAGNTSGSIGSGVPQIASSSPTDVWFNPGFTRFWSDGSQPADPVLFHWDGHSWAKVVAPL